MAKPTIYTIAQAAGVSTATVSKILNHQGNISQETAMRVMEIIKEQNYVPQQRKQHGNAIGVVTFLTESRPLASPFVATMLNGICREAFAEGRDITLLDGERIVKFSPEELHCFHASNSLCGLLGINLADTDPFCARLRASKLPFVLLANAANGGNFISTRNYESVAEMIDYILCMGHSKIAYFGLLTHMFESHCLRLQAYTDTLRQHEIPLREELIINLPDAEPATIKNALSRLLARPEPPTALFFASEELAAVVPTLSRLGVKIPHDLSVAGMTIARPEGGTPELSTIVQPIEEIGRRGVRCLLDLLENRRTASQLLDNQIHYGDTIQKL